MSLSGYFLRAVDVGKDGGVERFDCFHPFLISSIARNCCQAPLMHKNDVI